MSSAARTIQNDPLPVYEHTQTATLIVYALGVAALLTLALAIGVPDGRIVTVPVTFVLAACLYMFRSLTVELTSDTLTISFGPGWVRRRFRVDDIRAAHVVRNRWYYGWGIHWTPHGWLFNVSGWDAVELGLKNNRTLRIGTDEPQQLAAAIQHIIEFEAAAPVKTLS